MPGRCSHAAHSVRAALCAAALLSALVPATAQQLRRATVWDLKLGEPITAQPSPAEFRGFACGSNGGAPRQPLTGWRDFARCRAESDGLHEVYFEYDDELEYIARARDADREITRWAGTTEVGFPVVVSALFDPAGVLRGIRMVSDPRASSLERRMAHLLRLAVINRYEPNGWNCTDMPLAAGETPVGGGVFIKQRCEKASSEKSLMVEARFLRKPGQNEVDPATGEATSGQFESWTRFEIMDPNYRKP